MEDSFSVPVHSINNSSCSSSNGVSGGSSSSIATSVSLAMSPSHHSPLLSMPFYGQDADVDDVNIVAEATSTLSPTPPTRRKPHTVRSSVKRKCPGDNSSSSSSSGAGNANEANGAKRPQAAQDVQNQRYLANVRERQRTQSLNERFARLRRIVPTMPSDKMSKIHTLRLASYYIHFLSQMLDGQNLLFDQVAPADTPAFLQQLRYAFSVWRMGTTLHAPLGNVNDNNNNNNNNKNNDNIVNNNNNNNNIVNNNNNNSNNINQPDCNHQHGSMQRYDDPYC